MDGRWFATAKVEDLVAKAGDYVHRCHNRQTQPLDPSNALNQLTPFALLPPNPSEPKASPHPKSNSHSQANSPPKANPHSRPSPPVKGDSPNIPSDANSMPELVQSLRVQGALPEQVLAQMEFMQGGLRYAGPVFRKLQYQLTAETGDIVRGALGLSSNRDLAARTNRTIIPFLVR